jgi:hypothetical protein
MAHLPKVLLKRFQIRKPFLISLLAQTQPSATMSRSNTGHADENNNPIVDRLIPFALSVWHC